jgi:3-deoxy-D-arabino-heptulosonate 7-phosphate (DAHP) synthase
MKFSIAAAFFIPAVVAFAPQHTAFQPRTALFSTEAATESKVRTKKMVEKEKDNSTSSNSRYQKDLARFTNTSHLFRFLSLITGIFQASCVH